ncbi:MAG: hypothetical protein LBE86_12665 [Gemmobacter sp.]|nr:hypothetical protein [Gemmobacter sp.]
MNDHDFGDVRFSHGDGTVEDVFTGAAATQGPIVRIWGEARFVFTDSFKNPLDIGIEPGGDPYDISGSWTTVFSAGAFIDSVTDAP